MKTAAFRVGVIEVPLAKPFHASQKPSLSVRSAIVRLDVEGGPTGWGAAPLGIVVGETDTAILADLAEAARTLNGFRWTEPAEALEALATTTACGRTAIDIALHDAWAKQCGEPLWWLLGGAREGVTTSRAIAPGTPDAMAAEAATAVAQGSSVLKVVAAGDVSGIHERVKAVREAVPEVSLRIEAREAWTPNEAIKLILGFEDAGFAIDLVEQPVRRDDLLGLRGVAEVVSTPILADEVAATIDSARAVIELGAADFVKVKLVRSGGLLGASEVARLAAEAGVGCVMGALDETSIGLAAAAAMACGSAPFAPADLEPQPWQADPVQGGVTFAGDAVIPAASAGLGIDDVSGVHWLD